GLVLLATFTDPGGPEEASDYSADVNWGDGTPTQAGAGGIALRGPNVQGFGNHTHAQGEAPRPTRDRKRCPVTVRLHHDPPTPTVGTTATVSDPAVRATGGFTVTAAEGASSGSQTVATFTDPGGAEAVNNYTADINWGDGTPTQVGGGSISFA